MRKVLTTRCCTGNYADKVHSKNAIIIAFVAQRIPLISADIIMGLQVLHMHA